MRRERGTDLGPTPGGRPVRSSRVVALAVTVVFVVGAATAAATATAAAGTTAPTRTARTDGPPTLAYSPITPHRVADTRTGAGVTRVDERRVRIDLSALAPDVAAVLVSVTITGRSGFAVAVPGGAPTPPISHVNLPTASTASPSGTGAASGTAVVMLSSDRAIEVHTSGRTVDAVVVDVLATFVPDDTPRAGRLVTVAPRRLVDTRTTSALPAGGIHQLALPADVPSDVLALVVTITAVPHASSGFVTAMAASTPIPGTSLLNVAGAGRVRAVTSFVPASPDGIAVFSNLATDVIVDLSGYVTGPSAEPSASGLFVPLETPVRRLDTRRDPIGWIHPGGVREIATGTDGGVFFGTVTMVDTTDAGYVTTFAAGTPWPDTSTVNANEPLDVVSNAAVVPMSDRGIAVGSSHGTHLVVDQFGTFTGERTPALTARPAGGPFSPREPNGPCDTITAGLPPLTTPTDARHVVRIGRSVLGRPIHAEYHGPPDPTKVVLIIGQIHGNECSPLLLVEAARRHDWQRVGAWVIPTLNPDGHAAGTRGNASGVDLNRDGWLQSQPETVALMRFHERIRPALTVHVHSPNGQAAWYGAGTFVPGAPARSGATVSGPLAARIAAATGMAFTGAGNRVATSIWFLWQGQRLVDANHEALLIELYAIADGEVPWARPRPATASVDTVRAHSGAIVSLIEGSLG